MCKNYILKLKCTKFDFDPAGGAYGAPSDPLAGFKGPTSEGGEGRGRGKGTGRKGIKGGEGKGGGGRHSLARLLALSTQRHCLKQDLRAAGHKLRCQLQLITQVKYCKLVHILHDVLFVFRIRYRLL